MPQQVKAQLTKDRHWIDEIIDKYLDKFIEWAVKAFNTGKKAVKNAVGIVKSWLGFREEFTLPNKEKHSVFLDEQGRLMLASDPHSYEQFLHNDPVAQLQVAQIAPLVAKVDRLSKAYTLLEQQQPSTSTNSELKLATQRELLKKRW